MYSLQKIKGRIYATWLSSEVRLCIQTLETLKLKRFRDTAWRQMQLVSK